MRTRRVDRDAQKIVSALTFEEFITTNSGITAARALVNVLIDQQISQETGVRIHSATLMSSVLKALSRWRLLVTSCKRGAERFVVQMM